MSFNNLIGTGTTESEACAEARKKFNETFGGCPPGFVFSGAASTTEVSANNWQCELAVDATGRSLIVKTGCSYNQVHSAYTGAMQGRVPWKPSVNCPVCFATTDELDNWQGITEPPPSYGTACAMLNIYWEYEEQQFCVWDGHTNYDSAGACHTDTYNWQVGNTANLSEVGLGMSDSGTWNSAIACTSAGDQSEDFGYYELYKSGGDWKLWHSWHAEHYTSGPSFGPLADAWSNFNDNYNLDYTGFTPSNGTFFNVNFVQPANCSSGCSYPTGGLQQVNGPWWLMSQVSGEQNAMGGCYNIDGDWCGGTPEDADNGQINTFFRITGMELIAYDQGIEPGQPRCTQPITFSGVVTPNFHCEPCCEDGTTIQICGQGNTYQEAHADLYETYKQGYQQNNYVFVKGNYYDGYEDKYVPYANSSLVIHESNSCSAEPSSSSAGGTPLLAAPIVEELDELEVLISKDVLISEPPVLSRIRGGSGRPPARRSPRPIQCCPPVLWIVSRGCNFCNPPRPASVRGPICCNYIPPRINPSGPQPPTLPPTTPTGGACYTVCAEICAGRSENPNCTPTSYVPSPSVPGCQPSATIWGPRQFQAECCTPFSQTLVVRNNGGIQDIGISWAYQDMNIATAIQGNHGYIHIDWRWPYGNPELLNLPVWITDTCGAKYWSTYDIFVTCPSSSINANGSIVPVCYPPSSLTFPKPAWSSGACCVTGSCVPNTTEANCTALGGTYYNGANCTANLCFTSYFPSASPPAGQSSQSSCSNCCVGPPLCDHWYNGLAVTHHTTDGNCASSGDITVTPTPMYGTGGTHCGLRKPVGNPASTCGQFGKFYYFLDTDSCNNLSVDRNKTYDISLLVGWPCDVDTGSFNFDTVLGYGDAGVEFSPIVTSQVGPPTSWPFVEFQNKSYTLNGGQLTVNFTLPSGGVRDALIGVRAKAACDPTLELKPAYLKFHFNDPATSSTTKGACCVSSLCLYGNPATCANVGGVYQGHNTVCTPTLCGTYVSSSGGPAVPPASSTGACCFAHNCFETDFATCINNGGAYNGDGTTCTTTTCASFQCCDMQTLLSIGATGQSQAEAYSNLIDLFNVAYKPHGYKISILHPPEFNTNNPACSSTTGGTPIVSAPINAAPPLQQGETQEEGQENDFYYSLDPELSAVIRSTPGALAGRGNRGGLIGGWHSIRWGGRPPWVGVVPPATTGWHGGNAPLCAIQRPWCVTQGGQWNQGVCPPFKTTVKPDGTVVCEYDCKIGGRSWGGLCHYVAVRVFPPVQPPPGYCWGQAATLCKLDGTWHNNPSCHSSPLPVPPCSSSGGIEFPNESMTAECCKPFNYSNAVSVSAGAPAGACIKSAQAFAHNPDIAVTTFVTPDKKKAVYSVSWPDPGFTWSFQNSFTLVVTDCCDKVHTRYYGVDTRCYSSSSDYVSSSLRTTIICAAPSRSSWNFPPLTGGCCFRSGPMGYYGKPCVNNTTYAACLAGGGDWMGLGVDCGCGCPRPSDCARDCLFGKGFPNNDINGYYKLIGYLGTREVYQNPHTQAVVYFNYTTQLWEVDIQKIITVNGSLVALQTSHSSAYDHKPDQATLCSANCALGLWNLGEFIACPVEKPCIPTSTPALCETIPIDIPHEVNTNKADKECGAIYKARTPGTKTLELRVPKIFTEDEVNGKWIVIADNCGKYKYYKIIKPTGGNP